MMDDSSDDELKVVKHAVRKSTFLDSDDEVEPLESVVEGTVENQREGSVDHTKDVETDEDFEVESNSVFPVTLMKHCSKEEVPSRDQDVYDSEGSDGESTQEMLQKPPDLFSDDEDKLGSPEHRLAEIHERKSCESASVKKKTSKKKGKSDPMLEIRRETQRMIRESRVNLPYHQPKQRSLQEFLDRKKRRLPISINASLAELQEACNHLQKVEKEVEMFYKSDSDNEDECITNSTTIPNESKATNKLEDLAEYSQEPESTNSSVKESSEICDSKNIFEHSSGAGDTEQTNLQVNGVSAKTNEKYVHCSVFCNSEEVQDSTNNITAALATCTQSGLNQSYNISNPNQSQNNDGLEEKNINDVGPFNGLQNETSCVIEKLTSNCFSKDVAENNAPNATDIDVETKISKCITNSEKANATDTDINAEISKSETSSKIENGSDTIGTEISRNIKSSKKLHSLFSKGLPPLKFHQEPSVIEFDSDINENNQEPGVTKLMERFIKHASAETKRKRKNVPVEISVVSTEKNDNGDITDVKKEILTVLLNNENDVLVDPRFCRPGAKYALFKQEIQKTMAKRKEASWEEYQREKKSMYGCDSEDEFDLETEEKCKEKERQIEFEPAYLLNECTDEDLVEDDVPLVDKEQQENQFVDDEAEESDNELDEQDEVADVEDGISDTESESDIVEEVARIEENSLSPVDVNEDSSSADKILDFKHQSGFNKEENCKQNGGKFFSIFGTKKDTDGKKLGAQGALFRQNTTGEELEKKASSKEDCLSQPSAFMSESQVFDICSGKFPSQMAEESNQDDCNTDKENSFCFLDSQDLDSQSIQLTFPEKTEINNEESIVRNGPPEAYSDGSDNEELFKKKKLYKISFSDEEDENEAVPDDVVEESDESSQIGSAEECAVNEEEEEEEDERGNGEEVFYDSEEEIIQQNAQQFFEKEAELSESEWGSEDEVEKDLDQLEEEIGDKDDIDTEKLKEELGKIHMRQMLDDDKKDIRLLQELLLEDGELHSDTKRERKFQWKNLDGEDFGPIQFSDSDGEIQNSDNEEEQEENWRRIRHEREIFLSQQEAGSRIEENNEAECERSHFFQLMKKTSLLCTERTKSVKVQSEKRITESLILSPDPKHSITKPKFGSFLSKGESLLSRIAMNVGSIKEKISSGPKNSRNFVFGAISPPKDKKDLKEATSTKLEKRKIVSTSTNVKKLRSDNDAESTFSSKRSLLSLLVLDD